MTVRPPRIRALVAVSAHILGPASRAPFLVLAAGAAADVVVGARGIFALVRQPCQVFVLLPLHGHGIIRGLIRHHAPGPESKIIVLEY